MAENGRRPVRKTGWATRIRYRWMEARRCLAVKQGRRVAKQEILVARKDET